MSFSVLLSICDPERFKVKTSYFRRFLNNGIFIKLVSLKSRT